MDLEEALVDRILRAEDIGWKRLDQWVTDDDTEGLTLEALQDLSTQLRELTASHPLFRRGAQLRNAYIFGRGMTYVDMERPRHKKVLEDSHNESVMFSVEAYEVMNSALFNDGIFMVLRTNAQPYRFTILPLAQVTGVVTNPDDNMDIWYVQRSWSANGVDKVKWYPTSNRWNDSKVRRMSVGSGTTIHIESTHVVHMKHANRQAGWTFGVPDSFPALLWALAYSGYLKDSSRLVNALSKFAWNLTTPSKQSAERMKTRVLDSKDGVGAITMGSGDVTSVGVPSAQVNFNNGQPLAAMVAAAFGVPVIALLSSPGATGGSYGAAQTLDAPTLKGFEVQQNSWARFFREILTSVGSKDARVEFPSLEADLPYRQITSVAQATELGLLHRDEAREMVVSVLDVPVLHDDLPPDPKEFEDEDDGQSVVSKQGAPSKIGATSNPQGDTNHDHDGDRE